MGEVRVFLVRYLIDKAHMAMTIKNFLEHLMKVNFLTFSGQFPPNFQFAAEHCTVWKVSVFGVILVRMRENADQKYSKYGHLLNSAGQHWKKVEQLYEIGLDTSLL